MNGLDWGRFYKVLTGIYLLLSFFYGYLHEWVWAGGFFATSVMYVVFCLREKRNNE